MDGVTTPAVRSTRSRASRIGRGALIAVAVVAIVAQGGVIAGAAWVAANPRPVSDALTVWTNDLDPRIEGYAAQAGLSERGRFLLAASLPEILAPAEFERVCRVSAPGIGVLGCYALEEGRIHLYDVTDDDLSALEPVVAAHEMLHAAWDRLEPEERTALVEPLEAAFAALGPDHELVERIAGYEERDPASRIPELYAIIGTEVRGGEGPGLAPVLEQHYATFFADRSRVVALAEQVQSLFAQLEQQLLALAARVDELSARIVSEQEAYRVDSDAFTADLAVFEERAATPGGYRSQSVFLADRGALIERQDALRARRDATNALVDEHNALLVELETLNAEAAALNQAINVEAQPLAGTAPAEGDVEEAPPGG